jgi:uncharacterized membrane protein YcaP (DUF421 family)
VEDYSFDLYRIFFGDLPLLFFAEIALRTTILLIYTFAIIRTIGKRSAGELTPVDVVVIVALGSGVGDPMFYPDVPILHGIVVITLIVGIQRLWLLFANHNQKLDRWLKGRATMVVNDGVLDLDGVERSSVSKREIFQMARQNGYRHLGEIRRMYIEPDDKPSIFGFNPNKIRPGLPFEPPVEFENLTIIPTGSLVEDPSIAACVNCGQTSKFTQGSKLSPCPRCHHTDWIIVE